MFKKIGFILLGFVLGTVVIASADVTTGASTAIAVQSWVISEINTVAGTVGGISTLIVNGQRSSNPASVQQMDLTGSYGRLFVDGPSSGNYLGWQLILCDGAGTCSYTPITVAANGGTSFGAGIGAPSVAIGGGLPISSSGVTCAMSAGITCTATVPSGSAHCSATIQGTTPIAGACSISGTTATVTAASSNSDTWLAIATQ